MIQLVTYSRARHCAEPFLFIEFVHAHAMAKNNITNSVMHPLLTVNDMSTEGHQHRIPPEKKKLVQLDCAKIRIILFYILQLFNVFICQFNNLKSEYKFEFFFFCFFFSCFQRICTRLAKSYKLKQ